MPTFDSLSSAYDSLASLFRANITTTRLPRQSVEPEQNFFPVPILSERRSQSDLFIDPVETPANACLFNHLSSRCGLNSYTHFAMWLLTKKFLKDDTTPGVRSPRVSLLWPAPITAPALSVVPISRNIHIKYFDQEATVAVCFWTVQKELLVPLKTLLLSVLNPRDLRFVSVLTGESGRCHPARMDNAIAHMDGYENNMKIVPSFLREQSPPKLSKLDTRCIHIIAGEIMRSVDNKKSSLQPA